MIEEIKSELKTDQQLKEAVKHFKNVHSSQGVYVALNDRYEEVRFSCMPIIEELLNPDFKS